MKSETVRARIDPVLKHDAGIVLHELGLSFSEAIELFLVQVKIKKGMPFALKIPNAETKKAIEDADKGINITRHENVDEMFNKLGM